MATPIEELKEKYGIYNNAILAILGLIILGRIITGFILGQDLIGGVGGGLIVMLIGLILPVVLFIYIAKYNTVAYIFLAVFAFIGGGDLARELAVTQGIEATLILVQGILIFAALILSLYMLLKKHPNWNV